MQFIKKCASVVSYCVKSVFKYSVNHSARGASSVLKVGIWSLYIISLKCYQASARCLTTSARSIKYSLPRGYLIDQYKLPIEMAEYLKYKHCVYILCIRPGLYKFGITSDINVRMATHRRVLGYQYIVKIYTFPTRAQINAAETKFKHFAKQKNILTVYNNQHEIVKTNIDTIISWFDHY